ncbi:MAG: sporulation transcriptional regulator SpoIIID [Bacillota bacterium]|jgi:putative DeoR family transcriptional regulator (stage III sporulation protein D)|nr:sporulation transcriptional regulator SpoIIID [Bacillota bacterium]HHU43471.1 stage III sporulation protein D [Clostridiales bacterium]
MEKFLRAIRAAEYIIENNATVRQTAAYMGYGKSTVHTDVTQRLKDIDFNMYDSVKKILDKNYQVKHIRGGESTKRKYRSG